MSKRFPRKPQMPHSYPLTFPQMLMHINKPRKFDKQKLNLPNFLTLFEEVITGCKLKENTVVWVSKF